MYCNVLCHVLCHVHMLLCLCRVCLSRCACTWVAYVNLNNKHNDDDDDDDDDDDYEGPLSIKRVYTDFPFARGRILSDDIVFA